MSRKTAIDSIIGMMDGIDPLSGMRQRQRQRQQQEPLDVGLDDISIDDINLLVEDGMTNDFNGGEDVEAVMMVMPGDDEPESDMDMGRCEETRGFAAEDYQLAKRLVHQVGSIERVHELLANLEEVEETLDLEPSDAYDIDGIAGQMPDDPDLPTSMQNDMSMSSLYDPGHSDHQ